MHSLSSPRPWGCFSGHLPAYPRRGVFPTPVGVFPAALWSGCGSGSLPHARGGVSGAYPAALRHPQSSPRPWGCFCVQADAGRTGSVFPTPVGVFPKFSAWLTRSPRLPHARGGVSTRRISTTVSLVSSPRPWGCFFQVPATGPLMNVFPTPVGVFPRKQSPPPLRGGLPHARGGVSALSDTTNPSPTSSPRPWGCFRIQARSDCLQPVFPTPVGVFPPEGPCASSRLSLPHARGGVSLADRFAVGVVASSPRPWGCFQGRSDAPALFEVFPTPVGVFPPMFAR